MRETTSDSDTETKRVRARKSERERELSHKRVGSSNERVNERDNE